jgi:hypothetical protein
LRRFGTIVAETDMTAHVRVILEDVEFLGTNLLGIGIVIGIGIVTVEHPPSDRCRR